MKYALIIDALLDSPAERTQEVLLSHHDLVDRSLVTKLEAKAPN